MAPSPETLHAPSATVSHRIARSMVTRYVRQLDAGRKAYAKAGELLDKLIAAGLVGKEIRLSDGSTAVVVDQFAVKSTVFKSTPFSRFKLEVNGR